MVPAEFNVTGPGCSSADHPSPSEQAVLRVHTGHEAAPTG